MVGRGDLQAAGGGDDLMLGPCVVEVVEAAPERCYFPLELPRVQA